ncbi:Outer membrane protein beta-barrel domain-containing protein [Pontibacter akesuensis]|uniref:Outer membrane protein beta-barrel domain-containing protein n=2 Tax=Pontibacter akesuensis TaxID=388950 RepID=A0A1I7KH96_9BACT|nr:hypothetical protein GCM10007389_36440 [Pontibacter akesuensis]SFU96803.1 Outer membrane protein beta-barrel domain-containing protein [Pontibacter akesuensis]
MLSLVCLGYAAEAQTISVGPRVGATFAKINYSGDDADEANDQVESVTGLQVGAVANVMLSDMLSFQPEILVVQKGAKEEYSEEDEFGSFSTEGKVKTTYLEVPLLAKLSFGSESLKGFVTAGPSIGYWMSGKVEGEVSYTDFDGEQVTETVDEKIDFDEDEDYNRTELGASVGVGLAYKIGAGSLNLDVRYGFGLSSVYDFEEDDVKERNRVLGVSLAYLFSL